MPLQSTLANQRKGLCLLSLDAGGTRGVSQLKILAELMHRLNFEVSEDQKLLFCDTFDMIGGSGSGGFIAILLVLLGMNMEQAMTEFIELSVNILEKQGMDAHARMAALEMHVKGLLQKCQVPNEMRLMDSNVCSKSCKLVVPISYKRIAGSTCLLRNFAVRQEETLNLTIAEAMVATLASPPLFTSTSVFKDSSTFEYISANLTLSNPTRVIISEAFGVFGEEARVASLLNIGCGHPGIIKCPETSGDAAWIQFLERLATDSEQKAEEIMSQMGHLGLYHRFSVMRGLERQAGMPKCEAGDTIAHTTVYLTGFDVSQKLDTCAESLRQRDGVASLGQLKQTGGRRVLPAVLPPLAKNFVMRRKPWEFIEKAMLGPRELSHADEPRMLVVTGMGGCGKTQITLKFMHMQKDKFSAVFFIDGSSVPRICTDTIRHVRALGVAHSQTGFEDCLLFLSQPSPGVPRLILYDNVDDPDIDLAPLLPSGESCAIMITSRNRSLGELSPETHLELDTMSLEEAVDLLLQRSGRSTGVTDHTCEESAAVARALGCLPIALTQARSYMYQTQCSPGEYLERLSTSRDTLLAQPVKNHRDMRYISTYAAFDASFGLLAPHCRQLLRLLSCFHWNDFPLALVTLAAKHTFSDYRNKYIDHGAGYYTGTAMLRALFLPERKWDVTELDKMVFSLREYSLITLIPGVKTQLVRMHPVTHGWVRSCIPEHELTIYLAAATVLLSVGGRDEHAPFVQYLKGHITHMSTSWDQLHINDAEMFARILDRGGSFEAAIQLRERVLAKLRNQDDNCATAGALWALANSYINLRRFNDAEPLQREAVKLKTEIQGKDHPETIRATGALAYIHSRLGKESTAVVLQEETLKLSRERLGTRHPDTLQAASNLSLIYCTLGRLNEAALLLKEVLMLRKEVIGEQHGETLDTSRNLASFYCALGRPKEAELLLEWSLKLSREIVGERHPDTLRAYSILALAYQKMGRLQEAVTMQERTLKLEKEVLGERHPETIVDSERLKDYNHLLEGTKLAGALLVKTLRRARDTLGNEHPTTTLIMLSLAEIYESLYKKSDSLELINAALLTHREDPRTNHARYLLQQVQTRVQALPDE